MRDVKIDMPDALYFSRDNMDALQKAINEVTAAPIVALDTETTGLRKTEEIVLFWSLSWGLPGQNNRVCLCSDTLPMFADAFKDPNKSWVFANAKFDAHMLANMGVSLAGNLVDTQVMHALLYEDMPHRLKFMMHHLFGWTWRDFNDVFPRQKGEGVGDALLRGWEQNPELLIEYSANDAYGTLCAYWELEKRLEEAPTIKMLDMADQTANLLDLFWEIEVPYTKVLWKCERHGAKINTDRLNEIRIPMEEGLAKLRRDIMRTTDGVVSNPNSNDQWKKYLFDIKKYPVLKKTKGGKKGIKAPSVDADSRGRLLEEFGDEALKHANEHAKLSKLHGTYVMGLQNRLTPRGYVHTSFNQDIARCMPAGELVFTNRGYIPVEEVRVGDLVLTHLGNTKKVVEVSTHKPKPIYRVELANGLVLFTTGNHEYCTGLHWTRADALKKFDEVVVHSEPEAWAPIKGWEDFSISSWGRVYNKKTGHHLALRPKGRWGHLKVGLYRNGAQKKGEDRKTFAVHRLVMDAFGFYEPGREETRHLNGIAWDNTIRNLSCGSSTENTEDARQHGTLNGSPLLSNEQVEEIKRADRLGQPASSTSKLSFSIAEAIRKRFARGETRTELARDFEVSYQAIDGIVKGRTWAREKEGVTAEELAVKYNVSPAAIRDIWAGRRWDRDLKRRCQTQATFYLTRVVGVTEEPPEVTYGLMVEDDHSHVTGGVVTHNTGRLSSSDPNMQNWPRRDEDVYKLRDALIAEPGYKMLVYDYAQLEMRILADMSHEEQMIKMIIEGRDIHMGNASLVFDVPYDDIKKAKKMKPEEWEALTKDQVDYYHQCLFYRQAAKTIGFGQPDSQAEVKLPQNGEPYGQESMATPCCAARHSLSTCARLRRASTGRRHPGVRLVMPHAPLTRGARRKSLREGIVSPRGNSGSKR